MEWTSDQTDDQNANPNKNSKVEPDGKLIKPPENNSEAIQTGPTIDSEVYPMNRKHRGKALIFSHYFEGIPNFERKGNKVDEDGIKKELDHLNFDVKVYPDKKMEEIKAILKTTSEEDHSENDCLVVVVMSHGRKVKQFLQDTKYEICAKDGYYNENVLFENFDGRSCPTLHGKPKIFLIQACRGRTVQPVTKVLAPSRAQTEDDGAEKNDGYYYLPDAADFFIFRATYDTVAWRNEDAGSYFIQRICDQLSENKNRNYNRDFMTMMTFVILKVATQKAQQPNIFSTLTRLLYLMPKRLS